MKKLVLSILTILYLASTTGAMLEKHFCMGEVADWSLGKSKSDRCAFCGMPKNAEQDNGCCSDQEGFFKLTDDQKAQTGIKLELPSPDPAVLPHVHYDYSHAELKSKSIALIQSPPRTSSAPRYVLISVFRI